ncbi:hypothetical protein ALI144C_09075 [Actinosynnema sp. ALI-1.44]|uniref:hypothetical protein n=1 Tax=Actinosynnema sp. ALI-1.44 TaxID=1933779 RepID=UPI00097C969F|nr:hypothetical protein [Actinosynnema sp. ALI-1.44]ONI87528.1 hypothetical protein ALI144C_09075 [Actinosynnema sp. ALI-1.44]
MESNQEPLLAAIGEALGLDGPFPERPTADPSGDHGVQVLNGVVGRKRVAWVERHVFPSGPGGEQWVNVWLRVAGDGVADVPAVQGWVRFDEPGRRITVPLNDRHDDHLSGVPYMDFFDDTMVVVYSKAGRKTLCRLAMSSYGVVIDRTPVGDSVVVLDRARPTSWQTTLCHIEDFTDEHLMYQMSLPGREARVPIPVPKPAEPPAGKYVDVDLRLGSDGRTVCWVEQISEADQRSLLVSLPETLQRGYVDDPELVWRGLRDALGGPDAPADGPDILIGAIAAPFWNAPQLHPDRGTRWFPVAWYRFLLEQNRDEAAGWLRWLQRLATGERAQDQWGWAPEWQRVAGVTRFALIHVHRQAAVLAETCRTGARPTVGDLDISRPVTAYPAGFARAWRLLPDRFRPGRGLR